MIDIQEQIEAARRQVAICQNRAARPGSSIEDELSLQNARNWLLTLELRVMQRVVALHRKLGKATGKQPASKSSVGQDKPRRLSARDRAEAAFAQVRKGGA